MLRGAASKVMWVGRATVFLVGLAVILALVFGVATTALGANGNPFLLGKSNVATALSKLTGNVNGAAMQVVNSNAGADDTALSLSVQAGESPMRVNSPTKVANLNADKIDGKDFSDFDFDRVLRAFGSLPQEGTFTSTGGTLIISATGSGFRGTGTSQKEGRIGMAVFVDGKFEGVVQGYTNERNSHKAFVPQDLDVPGLPAGQHTIRLEEEYDDSRCNTVDETQSTYCTDTDNNDIFHVTVLEIPD